MKSLFTTILILLIMISLNACGAAVPPVPTQEPAATITKTISLPSATPEPTNYPEVTLKINSSPLTSFAPIFIAEAEGYFTEFGLKMEYVTFNKSTDAVPLVITGDLDVYAGSINAAILNVLRQENNIKVVADRGHIAPGDSCTYLGLLVRKDLFDSGIITGPAGLAGETIASSSAGTTGYLLSTYLAQAGLTFDDVVMNDIPTAGYVDAFTNKSLAVIVAPELHLSRILNGGNAVLLADAQDVTGAEQIGFIAFGKNLLRDHPDVGTRFMAAYLKGVLQYNQGKTARNLQIMSDATGETIETLQAACWVPINTDGSIDFSGIEGFQQWSIAQDQLEAPVTEEQFFDSRFITAGQALLNP